MKLLIAGSRTFDDYDTLCKAIARVDGPIDEIISGHAKGADRLGERFAQEYGIKLTIFPADWTTYGKSAGYRRNKQMIEAADEVLVFWDGKSKGTHHTIKLAYEYKKPMYLWNYGHDTIEF